MNRLTKRLSNLKNNNKKALVGYLVAGDPDIDTTIELMKLFTSSGVDIIEIGVPFTDPIAEGPIIQKAHDRALKKGISLESIFKMIEKYRHGMIEKYRRGLDGLSPAFVKDLLIHVLSDAELGTGSYIQGRVMKGLKFIPLQD